VRIISAEWRHGFEALRNSLPDEPDVCVLDGEGVLTGEGDP